MNTPKQGLNVCQEHERTTTTFIDCSSEEIEKKSSSKQEFQGVINILEKKGWFVCFSLFIL